MDTSFVDTMKALINYAGACFQLYVVQSAGAQTEYILGDTVSFDYIPMRRRSTYSGYVRFAKQIIKNQELLDLLQTVG